MDESLRVAICGTDGNSNFLTRIKSMSFQPDVLAHDARDPKYGANESQ